MSRNRYVNHEYQANNCAIKKARQLKTSELGHDLSFTSLFTHAHTLILLHVDCVKSDEVTADAFTYISDAQQAAVLPCGQALLTAVSMQPVNSVCNRLSSGKCGHVKVWRRHAGRYNEAHLIKSLYCLELMKFQTS
jgi:hypothetical protein